jgi:hypothetical protein
MHQPILRTEVTSIDAAKPAGRIKPQYVRFTILVAASARDSHLGFPIVRYCHVAIQTAGLPSRVLVYDTRPDLPQ